MVVILGCALFINNYGEINTSQMLICFIFAITDIVI